MKKAWIIVVLFSFLVTLNAKEVMGKYISFYVDEGTVLFFTFEINGVEKVFESYYLSLNNEALFNKHKNELVRIQLSDDGYKMVKNVYFKDGSNAIGEKEIFAKFIRFNENKHRVGNLIFELEGKEVIFSGYDLNIVLSTRDQGKMYHIAFTETLDKLKVIESISLETKEKKRHSQKSTLTTLNAKEKEVVGEYISYKVLPVGYELSLKIDGKEKVFFTFQVNEEVLKKHKNEFVRIKLYDGEGLKNVYFNNGNTAIEEYDFSTDMDANEKACNNGNAQKCYELAQENAGFLEATGYYNTACEGGHVKACYELASIYELGNRAVEKDVELSKKFYRMACKGGYSDACGVE